MVNEGGSPGKVVRPSKFGDTVAWLKSSLPARVQHNVSLGPRISQQSHVGIHTGLSACTE